MTVLPCGRDIGLLPGPVLLYRALTSVFIVSILTAIRHEFSLSSSEMRLPWHRCLNLPTKVPPPRQKY